MLPPKTMVSTSPTGKAFDPNKGRLILDDQMAFDLLDILAASRVQVLSALRDLEGADDPEMAPAIKYLNERLKRQFYLRRRVERLIEEKGWGAVDNSQATAGG